MILVLLMLKVMLIMLMLLTLTLSLATLSRKERSWRCWRGTIRKLVGRSGRMWSSGSSGEDHFGPGAFSWKWSLCERTFWESESEYGLIVFSRYKWKKWEHELPSGGWCWLIVKPLGGNGDKDFHRWQNIEGQTHSVWSSACCVNVSYSKVWYAKWWLQKCQNYCM